MYEYNKVINAIATFIDEEILTNINGWQKWVLGSGIGIALSDAENLFNTLKNNELVKVLKIIDGVKINFSGSSGATSRIPEAGSPERMSSKIKCRIFRSILLRSSRAPLRVLSILRRVSSMTSEVNP